METGNFPYSNYTGLIKSILAQKKKTWSASLQRLRFCFCEQIRVNGCCHNSFQLNEQIFNESIHQALDVVGGDRSEHRRESEKEKGVKI